MTPPCRFGASCTRANCWFAHPNAPQTVCREGAECTRADCWFRHPEGWVATPTPCRHGASCTWAKCWFAHPAERPDPNSESVQRERYCRSIFVGRLSVDRAETKDEDLKDYFERFGEIVVCSVARANNSKAGKSRGFGWVEFRDKQSADAAIEKGHPVWQVQQRTYQPSGGTFLAAHDRTQRVSIKQHVNSDVCMLHFIAFHFRNPTTLQP